MNICSRFLTTRGGGRGGRFLQGNLWHSPPAIMTSRLASITFKMASKVFIEETDKNFDFITEIRFRFLGFRDFNNATRSDWLSETLEVEIAYSSRGCFRE